MIKLLTTLGLLVAAGAFANAASTNVTVLLDPISVVGTHSNVWFFCHVRIDNQTDASLTATNLFARSPGLALKVSDLNGLELKRTYAAALHTWKFTFAPGSQTDYKLMYGVPSSSGSYGKPGISLPDAAKSVRLQIEGAFSGSGYSGGITSNVVEVNIP